MVTIAIVIIISALILCYIMWRNAHLIRVIEQEIAFIDLPKSFDGWRIFFISDIHRRKIPEKLIQMIKGKANLIIIGGDLLEKGVSLKQVEENIKLLKTVAPVYFVWGNNDYEIDYHELDALLLQLGVTILANSAAHFESDTGEKVALLGVDSVTNNRDRLELAVSDSEDVFRILACHDPKIIEKINKEDNIKFVLCGHTHGGQIRIFNFGMYEKGSLRQADDMWILISNGFGTTLLPFRLGTQAETHLLVLKKA